MVLMGTALLPGKNSFSKRRILDSLFKPSTQTMGIVGYENENN